MNKTEKIVSKKTDKKENSFEKINLVISFISLFFSIIIGFATFQISNWANSREEKTAPLNYSVNVSDKHVSTGSSASASGSNVEPVYLYQASIALTSDKSSICGDYQGIQISFVENGKIYSHFFNYEGNWEEDNKLTGNLHDIDLEIYKEDGDELTIHYESTSQNLFDEHIISYISLIGYDGENQNFAVVFGSGEEICCCIDMKQLYDDSMLKEKFEKISITDQNEIHEYTGEIEESVRLLEDFMELW